MTIVPVVSGTTSSLLLPLIFFSLGYPGAVTGYSSSLPGSTAFLSSCWAAPEVDKKVGHWVLGAGASRNFRECGTGGKTSILGIHEGWKLICAGAYTSMWSGLLCVCAYLCGPPTQSKLVAMCVSARLCVYNTSSCSRETQVLFKGLTLFAFCHGNLSGELKRNFLLKCHQELSGFRCMVWNI